MLVTCFAATAVALWISVGVAWAVENRLFVEPLKVWKRQSKLRKSLLVGVLACAVAFAGTKPGSTDGGDADTGGSATNDVTQVEGDAVNTNDVGFADGDTNGVGGGEVRGKSEEVRGNGEALAGVSIAPSLLPPTSNLLPPTSCLLQRMGTNEVFDFAPPEGAVVATNWLLHGAATDRQRLVFDDWAFPFGGGNVTSLCAYACGEVLPAGADTNLWLRPFAAPLGIVPAANWHLLPPPSGQSNNQTIEQSNISPSLFWHQLTPSNTLLLTWQNALLGRDTNNPVSFQAELKPSGGFAFRYDLSRLPSDELLTNATIGVQADGTAFSGLPAADLTSLTFQTADEQACDAFRDEFAAKVGDSDPYDFPPDSTNTVLEHLFYSGTTNGAFAYPQSTDGSAVLT